MSTKKTTRKTRTRAKPEAEANPLQRKAQLIIKLHGITFGFANGRRCIYADHVPADEIEVIRAAMREGLV